MEMSLGLLGLLAFHQKMLLRPETRLSLRGPHQKTEAHEGTKWHGCDTIFCCGVGSLASFEFISVPLLVAIYEHMHTRMEREGPRVVEPPLHVTTTKQHHACLPQQGARCFALFGIAHVCLRERAFHSIRCWFVRNIPDQNTRVALH